MAINQAKFDGPIPGENFTSDTRNYPWHRPPEITDLDEGIEFVAKKLTETETAQSILTFLEMGIDVASIVDLILTAGMGEGKWTLDFGLLLAGPMAHIICMMAQEYDVDYDLGIKAKRHIPSKKFLSAVRIDQKKAEKTAKDVYENFMGGGDTEVQGLAGFMGDTGGQY